MKRIQTILICLLFGFISNPRLINAQTSLINKADSLYVQNKPAEALILYEKIIDTAIISSLPKDETYFRALNGKMGSLGKMREYQKVFPFIDSIKEEFLSGASQKDLHIYLIRSGAIYGRVNNGKEFLDRMYDSYLLAKKMENPEDRIIKSASEMAFGLAQLEAQYDSGILYYKEAIKLETELNGKRSPLIGTLHGQIGLALTDKGEIRTGLSQFTKAVTHTVLGIDSTFNRNAPVSQRYDSLETYLAFFIEEVKEKNILKDYPSGDLPGITNIAYTLFDQGYLNLAEDFFLTAEKEYIHRQRWGGLGSIYNGLATIYSVRKQYEYSLRLYRKSESYFAKAGYNTNRDFAWLYNNMAILFNELRQIDSSSYYNEKALSMRRNQFSEPNAEIAASYLNIAMDKYVLKEFDEALKYFDKSIKNGYRDLSELYFIKGMTLKAYARDDSAIYYMKESLKYLTATNDNNQNYSYNAIGKFYKEKGMYDSALAYYNKSIISNYSKNLKVVPDNLQELDFSSVVNVYPFLSSVRGRESTFGLLYDSTKNIDYLKRQRNEYPLAKEAIQKIRTSFIQEIDNSEFSDLANEIINGSLTMYAKLHKAESNDLYLEEAFKMIDLGKSQIVLDAVKSRQIASSTVDNTLLQWSRIKNKIARERAALRELMLKKASADQFKSSQNIIDDLEKSLTKILNELRLNENNLYSYLSNEMSQFSINELKKYAKESGSTVIQYFWGENKLFIVSINDEKWNFRTVKLDSGQLSERIESFKHFVSHPESVEPESFREFVTSSYDIYTKILDPILTNQGNERLIIIPDGPLSNFPFEALINKAYDGTKVDFSKLPFLLKSFEIDYISSAAILLENEQQKTRNTSITFSAWAPFSDENAQAISDSEVLRNENLSDLPGTGKEIASLEAVFKGNRYYKENASEENFKEQAGQASIIHIATHGIVNDEEPLFSNLVFGEAIESDSSEDNRLYMFELYAMNLNSELAVLTSCNTGAGKIDEGEGSISLARAFKYAGVKSVLMSLWLANDNSTSSIIGKFYNNLAQEQHKGEALRNAKLTYLDQADNITSHPFYWSHLILSGDNSPITPAKRSNQLIMIILGATILLVIISRVIRRKYSA